METPCRSCDAECCGHYAIYITHADAVRLARATGRGAASFCAAEHEVFSPHLPRARVAGREIQLVLRADEATGACLFQDPDSRRCRVHDHAPAICRLYPFEVVDRRFAEVRQRADVICAAPFPLRDDARRALRRTARRFWLRDLPGFERRVTAWNRRSRNPDHFEAFLAAVTRRFPPLL